jgi:glycosyltransferase involved in cell wall biosynthesis
MTTRVSVIVPTFGNFAFLQRALDSVMRQVLIPSQLILVVDGSRDVPDAWGEFQAFGCEKILITLDCRKGPGAAREAGRVRARGDFFAYLDSDDFWSPEFLSEIVAAIQRGPAMAMAYCNSVSVSGGAELGPNKQSYRRYHSILPTVLWGRPWPTSGCLWKRELVDLIGPWLPIWRWEDYAYDVTAGCLDSCLIHVNRPLCYVEVGHEGRVSGREYDLLGDLSISRAIHQMSVKLRSAGKFQNPVIQRRFTLMCIGNLIELLELRELGAADELFGLLVREHLKAQPANAALRLAWRATQRDEWTFALRVVRFVRDHMSWPSQP